MRRLILLTIISGCGGTLTEVESADFAATIADIWCQRLKECERSYYDASFDDHDDCVSSEESLWQETHDYYLDRDCQYTAESGATLYNQFYAMSCAELYQATYTDDFDEIWKCGG
jgi:hypothetical protein